MSFANYYHHHFFDQGYLVVFMNFNVYARRGKINFSHYL